MPRLDIDIVVCGEEMEMGYVNAAGERLGEELVIHDLL
jgi:hypothetical protein